MVTKPTSNSTLSFNYVTLLLLTWYWHIQIALCVYHPTKDDQQMYSVTPAQFRRTSYFMVRQ